jgi:hypothetical protein
MKRVFIFAGTVVLVLVAALGFFAYTQSGSAEPAKGSEETCITEVRTEDDIRELTEAGQEKLEKLGLSPEEASDLIDPGFFASEEVFSCPSP